jgi:hypothetical protein
MRTLVELINLREPAWPLVLEWIETATNRVEVLPMSHPANEEALVALQVTTRSPMGAIVYESGGLLVDHGWVRVLGSGHPRLPRTLPGWNRGRTVFTEGQHPPFFLIADDVIGGFFAVNGGAFDGPPGNVFYFAPDTLEWENLGLGFSDFLNWLLRGNLAAFYADYRWDDWQEDVSTLEGDHAYAIFPFPFAREGGPPALRSRRPVPLVELYSLYVVDLPKQLSGEIR